MTIRTRSARKPALAALALLFAAGYGTAGLASTAAEIDAKVDAALGRLRTEVPGSASVLEKAQGVLVLPEVIKAGFVLAGEGGEGALRIGGKSVG
jgi:lipid-binding SYLF domain-containing protein